MKKLLTGILVGLSAVVVLGVILKVGPQNLAQRGPQAVKAYWDDNGNWVDDGTYSGDSGDTGSLDSSAGADSTPASDTTDPSSDNFVPGTWTGSDSTPWLNDSTDDGNFAPDTTGSAPAQNNPTPAAAPAGKSQTGTGTSYTQCGKTAGLDAYPADHTVRVTPIFWSDGSTTYQDDDLGNLGQCGGAPASSAPTVVRVDQYTQCGKTAGLDAYPATDTVRVTANHMSDGTIQYQDTDLGNLGQCESSAPTTSSTVSTCLGSMSQSEMESRLRAAGGNVSGNVSQEIADFNNAACPPTAPVQQPTVQQVAPTMVAVQSGNTQLNSCGNGTNISSNINCSNNVGGTTINNQYNSSSPAVNSPVVITSVTPAPVRVVPAGVVSAQPQVVAQAPSEVKELPKTGVPLVGWLLGGLTPVGLKIRKFGRVVKEGLNANTIWQNRQFNKVA